MVDFYGKFKCREIYHTWIVWGRNLCTIASNGFGRMVLDDVATLTLEDVKNLKSLPLESQGKGTRNKA